MTIEEKEAMREPENDIPEQLAGILQIDACRKQDEGRLVLTRRETGMKRRGEGLVDDRAPLS